MIRKRLAVYFGESDSICKKWGWFFLLGLLLVFLGMLVMGAAYTSTLFSVVLLGFFLIGVGLAQIVHAFLAREWSGLFLSLFLAILYGVTGALCVAKPTIAAMDLTFLIGAFCLVGGLFRMIASFVMRFESWGWVFFNGLVTFLLGALIYSEWPLSGLWLIGTFVGVDIFLSGWSWIVLSLQAKRRN